MAYVPTMYTKDGQTVTVTTRSDEIWYQYEGWTRLGVVVPPSGDNYLPVVRADLANYLPLTTRGAPDGVASLGPDGIVPPTQLPPAGNLLFLNVKDFGANATAAFKAAFAAADAAGGATVLVPAGDYTITDGLVIPAKTIVWAYGARVKFTSTNFCLRNYTDTDNSPGYTGRTHIAILGGTWQYVGTGQPNLVTLAHTKNVLVKDATFLDVTNAHAVELNSTRGGRVINCSFYGYKMVDLDYCEAVQIDLPLSGTTNALPWDATPCVDILVQGNRMGPSDSNGPWGRAVGSHTATDGVWHEDVKVLDNYVDGALVNGVRAYQWRNSIIAGNQVHNAVNGIRVDTGAVIAGQNAGTNVVENITIADNTVSGCTANGIYVTGLATALTRRVLLDGNHVSQCGIGIHLSQTDSCEVLGGYAVDATASNCLYIQDSKDASVVGLRCNTALTNVVNLTNSPGTSLADMRILGAGNSTIVMTTSSDVSIRDCYLQSFSVQGFNISSTCNKVSIMGCVVRKGTGTGTVALSITATCTGVWYTNNDFRGLTISDAGTTSIAGTNQLT